MKTTKKENIRDIKIVLSGGGNDIYRILRKILQRLGRKFLINKRLSYVIIAAETNEKMLYLIKKGWKELKKFLLSYGIKQTSLVNKKKINKIYASNIVILSGGDTQQLLKMLKVNSFVSKFKSSNIETIIGISAGAIVLGEKGLGMRRQKKITYRNCLGLIPRFIIPHSDKEKIQKYPSALHLKEYQLEIFKIKNAPSSQAEGKYHMSKK